MTWNIPYKKIAKGTAFGLVITLSVWLWLPILLWKMGLILSDNFIRYFITDDPGRK